MFLNSSPFNKTHSGAAGLTWQDVVVAVLSAVLRHSGDLHRLVTADILKILDNKHDAHRLNVVESRLMKKSFKSDEINPHSCTSNSSDSR